MKPKIPLPTCALLLCFLQLTLSATPPNVIVLFADDLGYGDLSCYGHPTIRTPYLDQMAAEGLRLTSFYSGADVCSPARAALLTGRYPIHAGMPHNTGPGSDRHLPKNQILIPQILQGQGYVSKAIGKWHLGHQDASLLPVGRGFDHFFGLPYSNDMIRPWVNTDEPMYMFRDGEPLEKVGHEQSHLTKAYTEEALAFIRKQVKSETPFFIYLAYSMPHLPVHAPPERQGTSTAGRYGDVIETIDWSAGQIMDELRQLGIEHNTLVVFTSDNGPWHNLPDRMLAEGNERWHSGTAGHLRGAKTTSYEGGSRVPGIFWWPGTIPSGRTSSAMASTIDLLPTAAALAGATLPQNHAVDGYNLLPFLMGRTDTPRKEFIYSRGAYFEAIRQGPWKLRIGGSNPQIELFHLDRDPSEMYNVANRYPEQVQHLQAALQERAAHYQADLRELKP